ncbi:clostripain-related cysteine peptidase [Candidatus Leptofilum sp.]|uniref:clostripain-related cysteine peptidase n=1 Tax=Candidatus Leptofilum sp. TaxID=3241576 RepID=UPI003B599AA3
MKRDDLFGREEQPAFAGIVNRTGNQLDLGQPLFAKDSKPRVTVKRRRRTNKDGQRDRAEAPRRRPSGSSSPRPSSGGSGSSGGGTYKPRPSGGGLPLPGGGGGRMSCLGIGIIGIIILFFVFSGGGGLFGGGGNGGGSSSGDSVVFTDPETDSSSNLPPANNDPLPTLSSTGASDQTWTIMLYQDADDKILEQDIFLDLNEAERVGSSDNVQIVAQLDRFNGGFAGDGNWTSARRYYITRDNDLQAINSDLIEDLGEVNMADPQTLVDFVVWAAENYPADKYVLIMSDHGIGWPGGWSDPAPSVPADRSLPITAALGNDLYLMEIDQALTEIRTQTNIDQFELIGMDACLMGGIEIFSALAPHARYAVASQEVEPALGWAYAGFLEELAINPGINGGELGRFIVDSYIREDQRILDPQARQGLLGGGNPLGGLFGLFGGPSNVSPQQLVQQMEQNITLTVADLSQIPTLVDSINNLSLALSNDNQQLIAQNRSRAQSYTSVFGSNVPPSYIDLGHFAQLIAQNSRNGEVDQAVNDVLSAIQQVVIAEKHGPNKPGSTGVSIYFPNSQLYGNPITGPQSYTAVADTFTNASLWDDFLAYHYTGEPFNAGDVGAAIPTAGALVRGPGAGNITIEPIAASSSEAAPDAPVLLSTEISGENIGYVKLLVGFLDTAANSLLVIDSDYLESADTQEVGGLFYPVWPDEPFILEFEWEPVVYAVSDGTNSVVTLFQPQTYGESFEDAVYAVDGIYTYADGEQRVARLLFRDGVLQQVYGFNNEDGTGGPREIIPQVGDQFTVVQRWLDLDSSGSVTGSETQEAGTLTFSDSTLIWVDLDAAAGQYVVGFIVEDFDGNQFPAYTQITVH